MDSQKPQIEELQALQESLELQRRQALALILELQDNGAGSEQTEKARLKLVLINQELAQCKAQIIFMKRRQRMIFESPEKMQAMGLVLKKAVNNPATQKEIRIRDDAAAKVQILTGRKAEFEEQKATLVTKIGALKEKISQVLGEGADPSELNRQVRAQGLEIEDLEGWILQLKNKSIPEAEKLLSEAQTAVWRALLQAATEAKTIFVEQMNDHLAQAAEIVHSWQAMMKKFFDEYRTGRYPTDTALILPIDTKRTFFWG